MALDPEESETAPKAMPSGHNDAQRNCGEILQYAWTIWADRQTAVRHRLHANTGVRGTTPPPNPVRWNKRHTQPHWPHSDGGSVQNTIRLGIRQTHKSWSLWRDNQRQYHIRCLCAHGIRVQSKARRPRYLRSDTARYCAVHPYRCRRHVGEGTLRHEELIHWRRAKGVARPPPSGVHRSSCPQLSGAA